jgi:hypothetical protein
VNEASAPTFQQQKLYITMEMSCMERVINKKCALIIEEISDVKVEE